MERKMVKQLREAENHQSTLCTVASQLAASTKMESDKQRARSRGDTYSRNMCCSLKLP